MDPHLENLMLAPHMERCQRCTSPTGLICPHEVKVTTLGFLWFALPSSCSNIVRPIIQSGLSHNEQRCVGRVRAVHSNHAHDVNSPALFAREPANRSKAMT